MSQAIPLAHAAAQSGPTSAGMVKGRSMILNVPTNERLELIDLSDRIRSFIAASGVSEGQVQVWSLHTTAGVFINECQEALLGDMKAALIRLVPQDCYYRHNDPVLSDCDRRNGDAHLRTI